MWVFQNYYTAYKIAHYGGMKSPSESLVVHRYGISETVNSLGLSLFVLGFALGPLICQSHSVFFCSLNDWFRIYSGSMYLFNFPFHGVPDPRTIIGPVSEIYGRRIGYLIAWPLLISRTQNYPILLFITHWYSVFSAPSAFVHNAAVILIFRLFAGVAAGVNLAVYVLLVLLLYSDRV